MQQALTAIYLIAFLLLCNQRPAASVQSPHGRWTQATTSHRTESQTASSNAPICPHAPMPRRSPAGIAANTARLTCQAPSLAAVLRVALSNWVLPWAFACGMPAFDKSSACRSRWPYLATAQVRRMVRWFRLAHSHRKNRKIHLFDTGLSEVQIFEHCRLF